MINKKYFIFLSFTILLLSSNNVLAEVKIGIVKLDILFKEIPIYKESQNQMKNEFKPKADELKKIETSWNKLNDDYLKNERVMSKQSEKIKLIKLIKLRKNLEKNNNLCNKNFKRNKILNLIGLERSLRMR